MDRYRSDGDGPQIGLLPCRTPAGLVALPLASRRQAGGQTAGQRERGRQEVRVYHQESAGSLDLVPPDVLPISPDSLRVLPEAQARATAKEWEEDAEMLAWHRDSLDLLAQIAVGPWEKLPDARRAECLDLFFRAAYGPVDKLPEGASEGDVFALCDYVWALRDGLEEVFWQQPAVVSHLQWRAQKADGRAKG
jgi:hypothetical protein